MSSWPLNDILKVIEETLGELPQGARVLSVDIRTTQDITNTLSRATHTSMGIRRSHLMTSRGMVDLAWEIDPYVKTGVYRVLVNHTRGTLETLGVLAHEGAEPETVAFVTALVRGGVDPQLAANEAGL
jgi:hypothetical protein